MTKPQQHSAEPAFEPATSVLLIIDMISDFRFEDGNLLAKQCAAIVPTIVQLRDRLAEAGGKVVYVNDTAGTWTMDRAELLEKAAAPTSKGRPIVEALAPLDDSVMLLKPKHSAFFATPLDLLLQSLQAKTLILTGMTTHMCILFTAIDAYMRDFQIIIPKDAVTAHTEELSQTTLDYCNTTLQSATPTTAMLIKQLNNR
ncbi:cysteine hydrolase family protein [Herpetosiphon llansteffanensis]|uniref:cysteine hydrolase family protein n=1 Tax=Herpetosiphon llansteffanensis TaxID=2094568 RepID=UPI000D7C94DF|nr:isochorismatase family cysteine hydrolase [Herpetosiphon llansteffanensis]